MKITTTNVRVITAKGNSVISSEMPAFGGNYADAVQHLASKLGGIVVGASVVVGSATAETAAKCAAQYASGVNA